MFHLITKYYTNAFKGIQQQVWVLAGAMFVNRAASMVLTFCSLYFINDLHFSIKDSAFIISFYGYGSLAGSYLGGYLADRFAPKRVLIGTLLLSSLFVLSLIFIQSLSLLCINLFVYTLIADAFRPANSVAVSSSTNAEDRTRSYSLIRLAINLGFTIGPAIGGVIALKLGYKFLFILDAISSICAAIFLYFALKEIPFVKKEQTFNKQNEVIKSLSAYQNRTYLIFITLVFFYGLTFFQLVFTAPVYFKKIDGYPEDVIGYLLALNGLIVVLVEMPLIAVLSKHKHAIKYIIVGCACVTLSFATLLLGTGVMALSILFILIISCSEIFAMPFMMNYSIASAPSDRQGQYTALYSMAYATSFIAAPFIGLRFGAEYGMRSMLLLLIGISILLTIGFYWFAKVQAPSNS